MQTHQMERDYRGFEIGFLKKRFFEISSVTCAIVMAPLVWNQIIRSFENNNNQSVIKRL